MPEEFYLTKKKRKLTGKRLATFNQFWEIFNYKKGRAEAADAWLDIQTLTNGIMADIMLGAKNEAIRRQRLLDAGRTPKMAQGWITARRWEDSDVTPSRSRPKPVSNGYDNMVRALNILTNVGKDKFYEFCDAVGMPDNDREAVFLKFNMAYDVNKLAAKVERGV